MDDEAMHYRYGSENPFDYLRRSLNASHLQNDNNIHATDGHVANAAELSETSTDACYVNSARLSTTWIFDLPLRGLPNATKSTFTRISEDVKDPPTQTSNGFFYPSGDEERTANHGNTRAPPRRFDADPAEEARRARLARRKAERDEDKRQRLAIGVTAAQMNKATKKLQAKSGGMSKRAARTLALASLTSKAGGASDEIEMLHGRLLNLQNAKEDLEKVALKNERLIEENCRLEKLLEDAERVGITRSERFAADVVAHDKTGQTTLQAVMTGQRRKIEKLEQELKAARKAIPSEDLIPKLQAELALKDAKVKALLALNTSLKNNSTVGTNLQGGQDDRVLFPADQAQEMDVEYGVDAMIAGSELGTGITNKRHTDVELEAEVDGQELVDHLWRGVG